MVTKGDRCGGLGGMDWEFGFGICTQVYGTISQWVPEVQHRELYQIFCDNLCGKRI